MISGLTTRLDALRRVRPGARRASLVALLWLAAAPAWAFDLPELMGLLSKQKHAEARFVEQRQVRGFDGPLNATGTLSFTAPDQLVRRTTSPRAETMAVDGNNLTLTRSGRTRTMTLDSVPELLGLVEAMRATLAGNGAVLERYFKPRLGGTATQWTLDLAPIDARLASQIDAFRLSGSGGEVLGVEMEFRGGDRSVMTISPNR
jgi:outer membrane lipoprotein-sorting protein